jgi:EpsI family protein
MPATAEPNQIKTTVVSFPLWKTLVVLGLGLCTVLAFSSSRSINQHGASGVDMDLPSVVGEFSGTPEKVSDREVAILPKDTQFAKMLYTGPSGHQVNVQIVLAGIEKRSIHRPELCLPSQGWTIETREVTPVKLENGKKLEVMKLFITRPVEIRPGETKPLHSLYFYWFVGDHVTTPYHSVRILRSSWDRIFHRRNHRWAYVIVSAPVLEGFSPGGLNVEETEKLLENLVAKIAPKIMLGEAPGNIPPEEPSAHSAAGKKE